MTTKPTDLSGTERGALMYRSRRLKDTDTKATLRELARSKQPTSDAVQAAQHNVDPLNQGA